MLACGQRGGRESARPESDVTHSASRRISKTRRTAEAAPEDLASAGFSCPTTASGPLRRAGAMTEATKPAPADAQNASNVRGGWQVERSRCDACSGWRALISLAVVGSAGGVAGLVRAGRRRRRRARSAYSGIFLSRCPTRHPPFGRRLLFAKRSRGRKPRRARGRSGSRRRSRGGPFCRTWCRGVVGVAGS